MITLVNVFATTTTKAGETLGATVTRQAQAAKKAKQANPCSKASARLDELVTRLCRCATHRLASRRCATSCSPLGRARSPTLLKRRIAVLALHEFRTNHGLPGHGNGHRR
jgi:hypothetical protein